MASLTSLLWKGRPVFISLWICADLWLLESGENGGHVTMPVLSLASSGFSLLGSPELPCTESNYTLKTPRGVSSDSTERERGPDRSNVNILIRGRRVSKNSGCPQNLINIQCCLLNVNTYTHFVFLNYQTEKWCHASWCNSPLKKTGISSLPEKSSKPWAPAVNAYSTKSKIPRWRPSLHCLLKAHLDTL